MKNFIFLATLALLLSSCATNTKSVTVNTQYINSGNIFQLPIGCDLVVSDQKATGSFSGKNVTLTYAKNMAVNDALFKSNGDVLIEPTYNIDTRGKSTTVEVQGFIGTYKNFRIPEVDTTGY